MRRVERSAKCGEFDLRDVHAEKRLPFKRASVEKEIHVVDRDGQVTGAYGIVKILGQYRDLGLVAAIGALPLVRSVCPSATDSLRPTGTSYLVLQAAFFGSRRLSSWRFVSVSP